MSVKNEIKNILQIINLLFFIFHGVNSSYFQDWIIYFKRVLSVCFWILLCIQWGRIQTRASLRVILNYFSFSAMHFTLDYINIFHASVTGNPGQY